MTTLYPRLLGSRAQDLFHEYSAVRSPVELELHARTSDDSAVFVATGGARVAQDALAGLATAVRELAGKHGYPHRPDGTTEFDVTLARLLHRQLDVAPSEAASREMWAFLSLVLLPHVAYWRFPNPPKDRVMHTDITRHVFGRLWWRAELVHDPELDDPYEALGILGEADFDQVYARRWQVGASPKIVRNILLAWRDLRADGELDDVNSRDVFRETLKALLRLVPFLSLNALDDEALVREFRRTALHVIAGQRATQALVGLAGPGTVHE